MTNEELKHAFMKDTLVKVVNPCPLPHDYGKLTGRITAIRYSKVNGRPHVFAEIKDGNAVHVISARDVQPSKE